MNLLLLGGTADARWLAAALTEKFRRRDIAVIYSIAGLVRRPQIACEIVSGGFTQSGGLKNFIQQKKISAILDATHPYAQIMSTKAVNAADSCHIPCWRFYRPAWQPRAGDQWHYVNNWQEAVPLLVTKKSILLTAGQLTQNFIDELAKNRSQCQLLRTAVRPKNRLPPTMQWIRAIGPFAFDNERALLQNHRVDILVSKNSGGDSTVAKLDAAKALAIPVVMLTRPQLPDADREFLCREECVQFINLAMK